MGNPRSLNFITKVEILKLWYTYWRELKNPQSSAECHGVNNLTVSRRLKDVLIYITFFFRQHAASIYGFVCLFRSFVKKNYCLNDQAHFAWFTLWVPRGQLGGSSGAEEDLQWKTTFDGRRPSMEDDLQWKTTSDGRCPLMEDDLWQKTTFDKIQPLTKDILWLKLTFDRVLHDLCRGRATPL